MTKLNQVLSEIQEGRRQDSAIRRLSREVHWNAPSPPDGVWNQVARELSTDASLDAYANRALIILRIQGVLNIEPTAQQIDVISATYGTTDVTRHLRQFFSQLFVRGSTTHILSLTMCSLVSILYRTARRFLSFFGGYTSQKLPKANLWNTRVYSALYKRLALWKASPSS